MDLNTKEVVLAIVAAIAALLAVGFTIKVISNKKSSSDSSRNKVKQKGVFANGPVSGRDNNNNSNNNNSNN